MIYICHVVVDLVLNIVYLVNSLEMNNQNVVVDYEICLSKDILNFFWHSMP